MNGDDTITHRVPETVADAATTTFAARPASATTYEQSSCATGWRMLSGHVAGQPDQKNAASVIASRLQNTTCDGQRGRIFSFLSANVAGQKPQTSGFSRRGKRGPTGMPIGGSGKEKRRAAHIGRGDMKMEVGVGHLLSLPLFHVPVISPFPGQAESFLAMPGILVIVVVSK